MPSSSRSRSSSFRIWSWMVTSSAVVGSSASSSFGSRRQRDRDHRALAHAAGELVRIVVERAARAPGCRPGPAARSRAPRRARRVERRYAPPGSRRSAGRSVSTGLSAVIGSWKIIAISRAAHARAARARAAPSRSRPRHSTEPSTRPGAAAAGAGSARSVTLLPEPDSPTRPSTSPGRTSRSMPSTAVQRPARGREADAQVADLEQRLGRGHRRAPQQIGEAVAEQAEAEAGEHDGDAREDRDPPGGGHEVLAVGDQHAPFGGRRLRAEAEIAEARAEQDGQRHVGHPDRRAIGVIALGRRWRKMMRGVGVAHDARRRRHSRAASAPSPRRASAARRTPSRRRRRRCTC